VVHTVTLASNTAGTPNAIGGQSCPHVVEYHLAEVIQRSARSMAPNPYAASWRAANPGPRAA